MADLLKRAVIVVGLGFGDEGKGLLTDYCCSKSSKPLVVRFNGGHQAGHTVVMPDGTRHVFSCFGSGTLRNVPSYWSSYCTFSPAALLQEYQLLPGQVRPKLFLDLQCPVTTHYDVLYNRAVEATRGAARHGSCGMGFGVTIERHQVPALNLVVQDLLQPSAFQAKLKLIREYYREKINRDTSFSFDQFAHDAEDQNFANNVNQVLDLINNRVIVLTNEEQVLTNTCWETFIFEGAQGILLDMDFGQYPHVTRSNTTSKNALAMLNRHLPAVAANAEVFYVSRCYQTRHGAGAFPDALAELHIIKNNNETNVFNSYQGAFQINYLDVDMLNYALDCDESYAQQLKKHLLITCLDQLPSEDIVYRDNGKVKKINYSQFPGLLKRNFATCQFSFSDCGNKIIRM